MSQPVNPVKDFSSNLRHAIRNRESVEVGGGIFTGDELKAVLGALEAGHGGAEAGDTSSFQANLKKAIFDRETVRVGGGDFETGELREVMHALQQGAVITVPGQAGLGERLQSAEQGAGNTPGAGAAGPGL